MKGEVEHKIIDSLTERAEPSWPASEFNRKARKQL